MTRALYVGLLTIVLSGSVATGTETYEYDELNRLTKVIYEDGSYVTYAYDAGGNVIQTEVYNVSLPQNEEDETGEDKIREDDTGENKTGEDKTGENKTGKDEAGETGNGGVGSEENKGNVGGGKTGGSEDGGSNVGGSNVGGQKTEEEENGRGSESHVANSEVKGDTLNTMLRKIVTFIKNIFASIVGWLKSLFGFKR